MQVSSIVCISTHVVEHSRLCVIHYAHLGFLELHQLTACNCGRPREMAMRGKNMSLNHFYPANHFSFSSVRIMYFSSLFMLSCKFGSFWASFFRLAGLRVCSQAIHLPACRAG